MRRSFVFASKAAWGAAAALALSVLFSCNESVPRRLDDPVPVSPSETGPAWGLDARPVSATCVAPPKPVPAAPKALIAYEPLMTKSLGKSLVDIVVQDGRIYVVDQAGVVYWISSDGGTANQVIDIKDMMALGYDSGLLSIAFHPKFDQNGYVYFAYTTPHPQQPPPEGVVFQSVVARFHSNDGGLTIDRASEKRLLVRDQPDVNHNGNKIVFGPDGYLYFACGDGGLGGQDKSSLFGKILRIDVDRGDPYAIPEDNPFADEDEEGAPEVYAYGLRNPWRFSFDSLTGDLWVGDVGSEKWEEIDKIVRGGNYGWRVKEGFECFGGLPTCDDAGMIDPVVVHQHPEAFAIVGGMVYRGSKMPSMYGKYIYSDFGSTSFWAISTDVPNPVPVRIDEGLERLAVASFAYDQDGEIVFVSRERAYRIVPPPVVREAPASLVELGCFDANDPTKASAGLFAYDVNVPQWLDGSVADRFLSVPGDAQIAIDERGRLDLPPGSIATRMIRAEGQLLETQVLMRRPDASWDAYTYAWSADQKSAELATTDRTIALPSGRAHEVKPSQCATCHAGGGAGTFDTIGLEAGQLDRDDVDYSYGGGRVGNPIATLDHVGMLSRRIADVDFRALSKIAGSDAVDTRARAYLHGNCAFCHDGVRQADMDLHFSATAAGAVDKRLCDAPAAMRAPVGDAKRMPPVGSAITDEKAVDVLDGWLRSSASCSP